MKKILSCIIVLVIMFPGSLVTSALTYDQMAQESVDICKTIGMVKGTGSGVTQSYLNSVPMRYQGAALLLRLKGLYTQAVTYNFGANYSDYTDLTWSPDGHNMIGYIHSHPTVGFDGYPDGSFKPMEAMNAKQYYKLLLVALGYEYNVDFYWNTNGSQLGVMDFANSIGLTWLQGNTSFTIRDLCIGTVEALKSQMKGGSKTLASKLVNDGAVDKTLAESVGIIPSSSQPTTKGSGTMTILYDNEISVAVGSTIITITLNNATFSGNLGVSSNYETNQFIAGIHGNLNTLESWDGTVLLTYSNITRLNDKTVTIDLGKNKDYRINNDEMITVTIPTSALATGNESAIVLTALIKDSGSGTENDPYKLNYTEDFGFLNMNNSEHVYTVVNDMDFANKTFEPINQFKGTLYGNHHTIRNLRIDGTINSSYTAMFRLLDGATIGNLQFIGATINAEADYTGILFGMATNNTTIYSVSIENSNIQSTASIIGGFGGMAISSSISDTMITNLTIYSPKNSIGGLLGISSSCSIDSASMVNININPGIELNNPSFYIAGVVGSSSGDNINRVTFQGDVRGSLYVGGIVGLTAFNRVNITNCNTYGTLSAEIGHVGGIVGQTDDPATITNCYAGQDSIYLGIMNVNSLLANRIIGSGMQQGNVLDNTARIDMKLINNLLMDMSHLWGSDRYGPEGETITMINTN